VIDIMFLEDAGEAVHQAVLIKPEPAQVYLETLESAALRQQVVFLVLIRLKKGVAGIDRIKASATRHHMTFAGREERSE